MAAELFYQSITALTAALESKTISSVELTKAVVARTKAVEGRVHAFNSFDEADALAQAAASDARRSAGQARGALDGIPIGFKDVIAVDGHPLTASSKMLANFVSPYDSTVAQRLKQAGAICWGRLNLDEFAMGSSTENSAFGPTSNPWDLSRVPGGSSGGSAAALAAGEAIATLGSDTGGSIRQPAALCGVVGLKPSYGLVSRFGLIAFASSLDQIGPFTRTVEDAAIVLGAIAGHDERDSTSYHATVPDYRREVAQRKGPWRLGIPKEYFAEGLDPEISAAVEKAVSFYTSRGCEVKQVSLPHTQYCLDTYYIIATAEASSNLARYDGIERPIFIAGLPRSGTTFLHQLLAADEGNMVPRVWQLIHPYPTLGNDAKNDRRRSRVARQLRLFQVLAPGFRQMHPIGADSPQECSEITAHVFASSRFDTTYSVPSYRQWLDRKGHFDAFRFHKRFLQHLQHQTARSGCWVSV